MSERKNPDQVARDVLDVWQFMDPTLSRLDRLRDLISGAIERDREAMLVIFDDHFAPDDPTAQRCRTELGGVTGR